MKNLLLVLVSMTLFFSVMGQNNQLILNFEPLPDDVLTAETPLVLSLQYVNENAMEAYIDHVFLEEDKAQIDSLHKAGVITDSLYQIYQDEWTDPVHQEPNTLINPSNISWEQENEDGTWSPVAINMHALNITDEGEDSFTSDLLFYGIDANEVNPLMQVKSIRAVSNGSQSNPIQLDLNKLNRQTQANSEGQLYYISNYWTLRQDHNKALQFADRIISNYPNAFSGYFQRGVSQYHLGQKNEALATFELAFDLVTEEQFGIEPPDRLLEYYYRLQSELLQPQKN